MDKQQAIDTAMQAVAGLPAEEVPNTADEEMELWNELLSTYRKLKAAKPEERSERSRRIAVCLTEYEKMLGYFYTMIIFDFEG